MIHQIVLGSGMRLFDDIAEQINVGLADSRILSTSVVFVTYQPAQAWEAARPR